MKTTVSLNTKFPRTKTFLDISQAAQLAGFSKRHFRRIIGADCIPVIQIGRKFFILDRDFQVWKAKQP